TEDILNSPPEQLAKQDFVAWLRSSDKYNEDFAAFNAVWQIPGVNSFDELLAKKVTGFDSDRKSKACKDDMTEYLKRFTNQLYRVVTDTIRQRDANHMIWGSRFIYWAPDEVVKIGAQYFDALAFDLYSYDMYRDKFDHYRSLIENTHPDTGFIITEFGFEN